MIRAAGLALVTLLVAACGSEAEDIPVVSGPNLPGAEIVRSEGVVESEDGGSSEATVNTQVNFSPQFLRIGDDAPGRRALLLAQFGLGPLTTEVESDPNVTTTITNDGDEEVTGIVLESSFAIDGEPRPDVVVSAETDAGACTVDGATVSCPIGTMAAGDTIAAFVEVREPPLEEGTVTVTTRLRAAVEEEPTVGPGDTPATPAEDAM